MTDYKLMIDYKYTQLHGVLRLMMYSIYRTYHLKAPRPRPHVMALSLMPGICVSKKILNKHFVHKCKQLQIMMCTV